MNSAFEATTAQKHHRLSRIGLIGRLTVVHVHKTLIVVVLGVVVATTRRIINRRRLGIRGRVVVVHSNQLVVVYRLVRRLSRIILQVIAHRRRVYRSAVVFGVERVFEA